MSVPVVTKAALGIRPTNPSAPNRRFLNPGEQDVLIGLVRSVKAKAVLEFGVNEGLTAKALLDAVPSIEQYQGIDVMPGYRPAKDYQRGEIPTEPGKHVAGDKRFELILRPRGSLDLHARDLKRCDVAFIDGDHGREAILHDSLLSRSLVNDGGLIIWHDYHTYGTNDARVVLDEFHAAGEPLQLVEGTWIVFRRA